MIAADADPASSRPRSYSANHAHQSIAGARVRANPFLSAAIGARHIGWGRRAWDPCAPSLRRRIFLARAGGDVVQAEDPHCYCRPGCPGAECAWRLRSRSDLRPARNCEERRRAPFSMRPRGLSALRPGNHLRPDIVHADGGARSAAARLPWKQEPPCSHNPPPSGATGFHPRQSHANRQNRAQALVRGQSRPDTVGIRRGEPWCLKRAKWH